MASPKLATDETFLAAYAGRRSRRHHDLEILTFGLGNEVYGLHIASLREIVKLPTITELPRVPEFLRGIIALRGIIIPVLDLRRRMGKEPGVPARSTRILIVSHQNETFGLIVDRVAKVERLDNEQLESAPLPGGIASRFVSGVAKIDGELIVLLSLSAVVGFHL